MIGTIFGVLILLAFPLLLLLVAGIDEMGGPDGGHTMPYDDMLARQARTHRDIATHRGERSRPTIDNILDTFDPTYWKE